MASSQLTHLIPRGLVGPGPALLGLKKAKGETRNEQPAVLLANVKEGGICTL